MIITVSGLKLSLLSPEDGRPVSVLRGVDFSLEVGESIGLVGESGSGKTMTGLSILRLLPFGAELQGKVELGGRNLTSLSLEEMRRVRGKEVAMIFQDPSSAMNPLMRVGEQIAESIRLHTGAERKDAWQQAVDWLARVGINGPDKAARNYPHELSGGMRQRAIIAMTLCLRPKVLIADEPTTALDVSMQKQVLDLVRDMRRESGTAMVFVSHDLALVSNEVNRVGIMYAGRIVESGPIDEVLAAPGHPYTRMLISAMPVPGRDGKLESIPGGPPDFRSLPGGCSFRNRCPIAQANCADDPPVVDKGNRIVECHYAK
jgi:oligopeptide/dipeptide ABC transporter ATP-binding protein